MLIRNLKENQMLQKNVQWFIDRLVERFIPSIGSLFTSAFQRMLILSHADQHDQLEEQALRYEAAGKPQIAAQIREQAKTLTLENPLPLSQKVLEDFDADNSALLEASIGTPRLGATPKAKRSKKRKRIESPDDLEGGDNS